MKGIRYCDDHDYMNLQYGMKRGFIRPIHTMFAAMSLTFYYYLDFEYVTKMRYNKEKDIVFVERPGGIWGTTETVYEMHHLE